MFLLVLLWFGPPSKISETSVSTFLFHRYPVMGCLEGLRSRGLQGKARIRQPFCRKLGEITTFMFLALSMELGDGY